MSPIVIVPQGGGLPVAPIPLDAPTFWLIFAGVWLLVVAMMLLSWLIEGLARLARRVRSRRPRAGNRRSIGLGRADPLLRSR